MNNQGTIQSAVREYVSSRAYYVESLNMSKQLYGDQHLTIASILNNLGNTDNALGEHVQSIQYNEAALRIYKQAHGEPHTHATVLTLNSLGTAYQALSEYTQGIQYYKEALAISKEAYEDKYPGVVSTLKGLFLLWEQSGCQDALHTLAGFLKTHMYKLHYTGVLASMASEVLQDDTLADAEAAKTIRLARMCKLLRLVDAAPREILGLQHLMLQLRLVNEWLLLCQGEGEEQQGVAALEEEFHLGERLSTWVKQSSLKYDGRYHHDTALARVPSAALLALLSTCSSVARCYKAELMKETLSMYSSQFESDTPDAHRVVLSALKSSVAIDLFAEEILPLLQLTISSRDCTIRQDTSEIFCVLAKRGISVDYVISSLCEAFQDDDPKVRLDVLASLRSLLENDVLMKSQILPLLEPSSHDSDAKIREMTVEIFCSLVARDAHVQVVLSLLKQPLSNSKLELHHDVLRVLASSIPIPAPEVIHHILNALEDRSYVVRSVALKALPTLVEKGAISEVLPLVQRALKDANIYTVLGVLPTLLELENGVTISEALPLIFNALKDSDSNMRYKAREALPTLLKDAVVSEALSAILSALKDEFRLVRNFAREALTILLENGVELSEALPHILNALQDREGDVRSAVLEELPTLLEKGLAVPEAVPLVLDLLQDSDHDVRRVAGRTLPILLEKGLVVPEPLLLVLDLLKNSDSNVRRVALRILETLLGKGLAVSEVLPLTQNALKDEAGTVRIAALKVLRALVEKGLAVSEALPLILHAFEDREDDTRIAALRALPTLLERGLALSEVLPHVQNALTDRDRFVRCAALEVLVILPAGGLAI
ncbi:MAG: HEAT repeat domain-containing protein, partial [Bacteroidota bacterium]